MNTKKILTIFTPTYNRGYLITNLYSSLKRQSSKEFEWMIIDDGSTDDTGEMVKRWMSEEKDFPIRYYRKENGGKCRAINDALDLAEGRYFFVVDSDDYLTDDAVEKIDSWIRKLPDDDLFCSVSGNCGTGDDKTSNHLFEEEFYDGTLLDRYGIADGERALVFSTEIHKHYMHPTFEGEPFITEAIAWNRMAHAGYKTRFYNDIIYVYKYRDDGLTMEGNKLFLKNPKGYALWLREKEAILGKGLKSRSALWYTYYCEMSSCEDEYRLTKQQIAEYIDAPLWGIYAVAFVHFFVSKRRQ